MVSIGFLGGRAAAKYSSMKWHQDTALFPSERTEACPHAVELLDVAAQLPSGEKRHEGRMHSGLACATLPVRNRISCYRRLLLGLLPSVVVYDLLAMH